MILDRLEIINEEFHAEAVEAWLLDVLLAEGWRHFGNHFYRYNFGVYEGEIRRVLPLRIRVDELKLSKSQRRVLRRNDDLDVEIRPVEITDETERLFEKHKRRFKSGVPNSIYDFISPDAANSPTKGMELRVTRDGALVAASFFDLGKNSLSSIYGIFDPDETTRSLGIFTMLKEIEYAGENGLTLYYHGYAYEGESYYDYKKKFTALEIFDWNGSWMPFATP
ncbi:hypothetical protein BH10ACI2_BH10ACI2_01340 [soil metagenome]